MEYGKSLEEIFQTVSDSSPDLVTDIRAWNDSVEKYLALPPTQANRDPENRIDEAGVEYVANRLGLRIVAAALQRDVSLVALTNIQEAIDKFREDPPRTCPEPLAEYIRASKNVLRWYIQIFLGQVRQFPPVSAVVILKKPAMIKLLAMMLEEYTLRAQPMDQITARNISLYIFYATYVVSPTDVDSREGLKLLIEDLKFPEIALRILTRSCTVPLSLSLVRNLHNAIVSYKDASKIIAHTRIACDPCSHDSADPAPWNPSTAQSLDFKTIYVAIVLWALSSDPPFPGDEDDMRSALICEVLGASYAVGAGQALKTAHGDNGMAELLVTILCLPNDHSDKRIAQCKTSTISLLIDSNDVLGGFLWEKGVIPHFLALLHDQVSDIVSTTRIDNSAAASLVPILVVINNFATANPDVLKCTKEFIFPQSSACIYQDKVQEQKRSESASKKKNMGPLDAPEGTLRRKLCTLLTWPESHIKRCTGELLWTLSGSNPTEFVHRVGFGNALPILASKGFAQMPAMS